MTLPRGPSRRGRRTHGMSGGATEPARLEQADGAAHWGHLAIARQAACRKG